MLLLLTVKVSYDIQGDQPRDILCGTADEIIIILKNDKYKDKDRKREIEVLIGKMLDEKFSLLVNLGKKITDWVDINELNKNIDDNIDETGVKVMIGDDDEDDDEDDNDLNYVNDEEQQDEDGQEAQNSQTIQGDLFCRNRDPVLLSCIIPFLIDHKS